MKAIFRALLVITALVQAQSAWALDHATPEQAKALLARAIEKINKDGPTAAFAAFDDKSAGFKAAELYVFAVDMSGKYMASGANPQLVGTNAYDVQDREGKYVIREIIKVAKKGGTGTVDYLWLDRADNKLEKKHSFVERVGDYVVGVGYYQD